jgi:hypothetical protein
LDSLGGIWTFQWVTANPNKKNLVVLDFHNSHPQYPRVLAVQTPLATRINRAGNNNIAHILTFEKTMCAPDRGDGLRVSPFRLGGVGGPVEATEFGPKPPQPKTGTPHFVGQIIQRGTQSGRSQAASVLCAMRAELNTAELIAVRCLNPLCQPSFCDEDDERNKNLAILSHGPPSVHEARLGPPEQPSFLPARKDGPPAQPANMTSRRSRVTRTR